MKKLLVLTVSTMMMTPALFAKGSHPMAGCGLAYVLFSKSDNSKPIQIFAATTNGTFGNQTFGITSGTLGCTEGGMVAKNKEAVVFADVNLKQLSYDMAVGKGETLNAFSQIIGINASKKDAFNGIVKSHYGQLFSTADTTTADFLIRLDQTLKLYPGLLS
ncbi:MAG: hypothetical protein A2901_06270 [Elusimicrobia bacterium RIFCSPLOWO2_01_FULL_54_10]|nr:MAG: hypothetical protein A2901_06270 [Elusimicrobia bacterium RIFCSPLOWO2_01_FULL_54_10]